MDDFQRARIPVGYVLRYMLGNYALCEIREPPQYRDFVNYGGTYIGGITPQYAACSEKIQTSPEYFKYYVFNHWDDVGFHYGYSQPTRWNKEEFELLARLEFPTIEIEEIREMIETAKFFNVSLEDIDKVRIAYRLSR